MDRSQSASTIRRVTPPREEQTSGIDDGKSCILLHSGDAPHPKCFIDLSFRVFNCFFFCFLFCVFHHDLCHFLCFILIVCATENHHTHTKHANTHSSQIPQNDRTPNARYIGAQITTQSLTYTNRLCSTPWTYYTDTCVNARAACRCTIPSVKRTYQQRYESRRTR